MELAPPPPSHKRPNMDDDLPASSKSTKLSSSTHTYAVPTANRFTPLASSSSSPTGTLPKSTSAASASNTDSPTPKVKYFPPIVAYFQVDPSFLTNLKMYLKHTYLLEFIQGA